MAKVASVISGGSNKPDESFDSGDDGIVTVNPADITTNGDSGSTDGDTGNITKRRGRKPGSRNATGSSKTSPNNLAGLESLLMSIHIMGAGLLKTPELILDEKETKVLAEAIANVSAHYPMVFNPKYVAIGQLVIVLAGTYGTRFIAINARHKKEKEEELSKNAINVTQFTG